MKVNEIMDMAMAFEIGLNEYNKSRVSTKETDDWRAKQAERVEEIKRKDKEIEQALRDAGFMQASETPLDCWLRLGWDMKQELRNLDSIMAEKDPESTDWQIKALAQFEEFYEFLSKIRAYNKIAGYHVYTE